MTIENSIAINAQDLIQTVTDTLHNHIQKYDRRNVAMIGIHTGGVWVAQQLHSNLQLEQPLGTLDISFYRDDFTQKGLHPKVQPSELPFTVEGQHLILVDDVIMSGRTIRAAMNELFDYGRPASISLVTLLDIDAKELPIQANIIGKQIALTPKERVKLSGPEPLRFDVINISS